MIALITLIVCILMLGMLSIGTYIRHRPGRLRQRDFEEFRKWIDEYESGKNK